jgi:hypothetical protein
MRSDDGPSRLRRYRVVVAKKGDKRPRAVRRAAARRREKLVREVRKLQALEPGASAEHPIEVTSTSQIEPHARSLRCLLCDTGLQIEDQRAFVRGGRVHRALAMRCPRCGEAREVHFVAAPPLTH